MEASWLTWAKRLQALASTGVHFGASEFDRERYLEIAEIANGMLAALGNVPLEQVANLMTDFGERYATPQVDVRGGCVQ